MKRYVDMSPQQQADMRRKYNLMTPTEVDAFIDYLNSNNEYLSAVKALEREHMKKFWETQEEGCES